MHIIKQILGLLGILLACTVPLSLVLLIVVGLDAGAYLLVAMAIPFFVLYVAVILDVVIKDME